MVASGVIEFSPASRSGTVIIPYLEEDSTILFHLVVFLVFLSLHDLLNKKCIFRYMIHYKDIHMHAYTCAYIQTCSQHICCVVCVYIYICVCVCVCIVYIYAYVFVCVCVCVCVPV